MNIGFLTRDWTVPPPFGAIPGGCAYYRCYLPMVVCGLNAQMGLPVFDAVHGYGVVEKGHIAAYGFDTVMLKLIMDRQTPHHMTLARKNRGQRIIIDIDDHFEGLTPANRAYGLTDPESNKKFNRQYYEASIHHADVITVSTPFLKNHYSRKYGNVVMIRNGVNSHQFQPRIHRPGKPVIGWAGSTAFRNNDLEQHDLTFHHAGAGEQSIHEIIGIPETRLTTSPLCPIDKYPNSLKFDIGLVPLNDIPFNHAKSNIKGLEYAAAGIPFIASDLPEYRLLHEDGAGTLASTPEQWTLAVERLLDHRERKKDAYRARMAVLAGWTIEHRASEWNQLLSGASSG
jgi:glycosyltransferase involved in cell wall biosynthesis